MSIIVTLMCDHPGCPANLSADWDSDWSEQYVNVSFSGGGGFFVTLDGGICGKARAGWRADYDYDRIWCPVHA